MHFVLMLLLKYKYWIIFPLASFEGPVVSLVVGFLASVGILNFWLAYLILLCGDIIPDSIFYYLGYFGHRAKFIEKHFLKSDFFINHIDKVDRLWNKHTFKTMFFGKLAYGMALPFLVSAGIVRLPYKKFISYAIPVTVFQYTILMMVGYYAGNSYASAVKYVDYVYYVLAALVLAFIFGYILVVRYAREKIKIMESNDNK